IQARSAQHVPTDVLDAFDSLGKLKLPPDDRVAWSAGEVRARVDAAVAAADRFQAGADENLYRSDAPVRQACEALSKLSRLQLAEEALLRSGDGLIPRLAEQGPVSD